MPSNMPRDLFCFSFRQFFDFKYDKVWKKCNNISYALLHAENSTLKFRLLQKINPFRDIRHIKLGKKWIPASEARPRLKSTDEHIPPWNEIQIGSKSTMEEIHLRIKSIVELSPLWN